VLKLAARQQTQRRRFNERLAAVGTRRSHPEPFRCECGLIGCNATIKLTADEYAGVRAGDGRFVVLTAHAMPETETVVATQRGWAIVEKCCGPAKETGDGIALDHAAAAALGRASRATSGWR